MTAVGNIGSADYDVSLQLFLKKTERLDLGVRDAADQIDKCQLPTILPIDIEMLLLFPCRR